MEKVEVNLEVNSESCINGKTAASNIFFLYLIKIENRMKDPMAADLEQKTDKSFYGYY